MLQILHLDNDSAHYEFIKSQLLTLSNDLEFECVNSFKTARIALENNAYDCIVCDDELPLNSGIELLKLLRGKKNLTPYIVLSDIDEVEESYKLSHYAEDEFNVSIEHLRFDLLNYWIHYLADKYAQFLRTQKLKDDMFQVSPEKLEHLRKAIQELTTREKEILDLIANSVSNHDIAEKLGISYRTVKNHVYSLFTKLGIHNRTEAVQIAHRMKIDENSK